MAVGVAMARHSQHSVTLITHSECSVLTTTVTTKSGGWLRGPYSLCLTLTHTDIAKFCFVLLKFILTFCLKFQAEKNLQKQCQDLSEVKSKLNFNVPLRTFLNLLTQHLSLVSEFRCCNVFIS